MSLWRPFPPGASALLPRRYIAVRCSRCSRGVVEYIGGLNPAMLAHAALEPHQALSCPGRIDRPWPTDNEAIANVARSLDSAARTTSGADRAAGIRQARKLRWPWFAWVWELLPA